MKSIIKAIEKYQADEISDRQLAHWMCISDWIINGGFKEKRNGAVTIKEILIWQITDLIDSLSFFDIERDKGYNKGGFYDLEEYKEIFKTFDLLYNTANEWEFVFSHTDELGDNEDDVVFIAKNEDKKIYVKFYTDFDLPYNEAELKKIEQKESEKLISRLQNDGYIEIKGYFK